MPALRAQADEEQVVLLPSEAIQYRFKQGSQKEFLKILSKTIEGKSPQQ